MLHLPDEEVEAPTRSSLLQGPHRLPGGARLPVGMTLVDYDALTRCFYVKVLGEMVCVSDAHLAASNNPTQFLRSIVCAAEARAAVRRGFVR